MTKTFYFHGGNRQKKATALIDALVAHGWRQVPEWKQSNAFFVDADVYTEYMDAAHKRGIPVFMYPHAARPNLFNDFEGYPIYPHIKAGFQGAEGHIEIMRRIGIQYPIEVIGWFYSPMRPFQKRERYTKVLFAPIHPNSDNSLSDLDRKLNQEVMAKLLPLVKLNEIHLTVRYIRALQDNGLKIENGVAYKKVLPENDYSQIDEFDVVVSHQTFAYMAIARGVPVLMMGEQHPPRVGSPKRGDLRYAKTWENYKDLLMYPLDILAFDPNLTQSIHEVDRTRWMLQRVIESDLDIRDWRDRLIGKPFDPAAFVAKVESYL